MLDVEDESSDEMSGSVRDDGALPVERARVRSRFRHHKQRTAASIPVGIFWDIENCQVCQFNTLFSYRKDTIILITKFIIRYPEDVLQ